MSLRFIAPLLTFLALPAHALELTSTDISEGQPMPRAMEFSGFGCSGDNLSPQLSWSDVPAGTRSFAITAYDPDAPTGSGWWHWIAIDLPAELRALPQGASGKLTAGVETRIDYGFAGFGGACPPQGHGMHRYQFTVWALPDAELKLPVDVSPAIVGYTLRSKALQSATLTATYTRK